MYMNEQLYRPAGSVTSKAARSKRDYRKVNRFFGLLAAIVLVLIVSLCAPMLGGEQDALAATDNAAAVQQTVEIEKGDTLWSIAGQHADKGQDVREYIHQIKKLNGLKSNVLHEGQILQLP